MKLSLSSFLFLTFFYTTLSLTAQEHSNLSWGPLFSKEWKTLEQLKKEGKHQTRLTLAKKVFDQSIDQKFIQGIVQSLLIITESSHFVDDIALENNISWLQSYQNNSNPSIRAVLHSYLAELYTLYLEQNRYRLSENITTERSSSNDLTLWATDDFLYQIESLYQKSIEVAETKDIKVDSLKSLVYPNTPKETTDFRTWFLYDLLMDRYLLFLQNSRLSHEEIDLNPPIEQDHLLYTEILTDTYIGSLPLTNRQKTILQAYLTWENFHREHNNIDVYLDLLIDRISFIQTNVNENFKAQDQLYQQLINTYKEYPHILTIHHQRASLMYHQQQKYEEAVIVLTQALEQYKSNAYSSDVAQIKQLLKSIKAQDLSIQLESVYPRGAEIFFNIQFQNVDHIDLVVKSITPEQYLVLSQSRSSNDDLHSMLQNQKTVWRKSLPLQSPKIYQPHQKEASIDERLGFGQYIIMFESQTDGNSIKGAQLFQVSNISAVQINTAYSHDFFFLHRVSGAPIKNTRVTLYNQPNYNQDPRPLFQDQKFKANHIELSEYKPTNRSQLKIQKGKDILITQSFYYRSYSDRERPPHHHMVFYTDRSIYQLGQHIQLKGILTLQHGLISNLVQNQKLELFLRDVNGQEVWRQSFETDKWGSISAMIPIPNDGLNGQWTLSSNFNGHKSIVIENYTRPNFEIQFDKSNISMTADEISGIGYAKTYDGFPVSQATVQIKVLLKQHHFYYYNNQGAESLLFTDTVWTDAQGKFSFSFPKIAPLTQKYGPAYYYDFIINVIDHTGEQHQSQIQLPYQKNQSQVQFVGESNINVSQSPMLMLKAFDGFGNAAQWQGKIQIEALIEPDQFQKEKFWADHHPNTIELTYPNDNLSPFHSWLTKEIIHAQELMIQHSTTLNLKEILPATGYYKMVAMDSTGNIQAVKYIFGYQEWSYNLMHTAFITDVNQKIYQPGDRIKLNFLMHRHLKQVLVTLVHPNGKVKTVPIKNGKSYEYTIQSEDLGGIQVFIMGQLYNRFYQESRYIEVPWQSKELNIQRINSQDTLDINSKESLELAITNHLGKGNSTEVSIAIFDAALEAYLPHHWSVEDAFYRKFRTHISGHSLNQNLGHHLYFKNNYWNDLIDISNPIRPALPPLTIGYIGRNHYMRSSAPMAEMSSSVDAVSAKSESEEMLNGANNDPSEQLVELSSLRQDFNESLLFFGKLTTDKEGKIRIPFETNDKVGRWKVLIVAHDQDLAAATTSFEFTTKKDVHITDFTPKYIRKNDQVSLVYTLYNNTAHRIKGQLTMHIENMGSTVQDLGFQMQPIELDGNARMTKTFTLNGTEFEQDFIKIIVRFTDDQGKIWDQILTPLEISNESDILLSGSVKIVKPGDSFTIEPSDNPNITSRKLRITDNLWLELLKSMPWLHHTNPVTTDQKLQNALYGFLGRHITSSVPNFEELYRQWKQQGELNQGLNPGELPQYKDISNTPWLRNSQAIENQMAMLALYFERNNIRQLIDQNLKDWWSAQNADGGFPWIQGAKSDPFITAKSMEAIQKMISYNPSFEVSFPKEKVEMAIHYLDQSNYNRWTQLLQENPTEKEILALAKQFHFYFYVRSMFMDEIPLAQEKQEFWRTLEKSLFDQWYTLEILAQTQIGKAAHYLHYHELSLKIAESFLDNAIQSEELGTYWRYNYRSYQQSYLASHGAIMELLNLNEITELNQGILQWIFVQKMSNDWHNNPAVFDLILLSMKLLPNEVYANNNYSVSGLNINPPKGNHHIYSISSNHTEAIVITNTGTLPLWVGLQQQEKVSLGTALKEEDTQLDITKTVVQQKSKNELGKIGDKITIQLLFNSDRDLDYVYIADPLLPGLDPGIVFSGFQYKNGLSYYQNNQTQQLEFFIRHLPKGKHSITYELNVVRAGNFNVPTTKIQSYFTPELAGYDQWAHEIKINSN